MNGVTEFQRDLLAGVVPLRARREPWMDQTLADHGMLSDLIATHGSPINLIDRACSRRTPMSLSTSPAAGASR